MTKADLYTFVTSLTAGIALDTTLFGSLLDIAQMTVEDMRPWVYLRTVDSSQTVSSSTTFTTALTLPTDFKEWYKEDSIHLVDSQYNEFQCTEVPFMERFKYRNALFRFSVDYPNNNVYVLGNITSAYTVYQYYIKIPTLISTSDSSTWVFPARFHKILGLLVAAYWKHGVDYDVINNIQADHQVAQALSMIDVMTRWDANLQQNMQRGIDPFSSDVIGMGTLNGGFVQI